MSARGHMGRHPMTRPDAASGLRWHRDTLARWQADPAVTDWFKQALGDLARRDPLDALRDCAALAALMRDRADQLLHTSGGGPARAVHHRRRISE